MRVTVAKLLQVFLAMHSLIPYSAVMHGLLHKVFFTLGVLPSFLSLVRSALSWLVPVYWSKVVNHIYLLFAKLPKGGWSLKSFDNLPNESLCMYSTLAHRRDTHKKKSSLRNVASVFHGTPKQHMLCLPWSIYRPDSAGISIKWQSLTSNPHPSPPPWMLYSSQLQRTRCKIVEEN